MSPPFFNVFVSAEPCVHSHPTGDIITLVSVKSQGKPRHFMSANQISALVQFLRLSMPSFCM